MIFLIFLLNLPQEIIIAAEVKVEESILKGVVMEIKFFLK